MDYSILATGEAFSLGICITHPYSTICLSSYKLERHVYFFTFPPNLSIASGDQAVTVPQHPTAGVTRPQQTLSQRT